MLTHTNIVVYVDRKVFALLMVCTHKVNTHDSQPYGLLIIFLPNMFWPRRTSKLA